MPINKDALKRYRIIDRMLSDPNRDYTTADIHKAVNWECPNVSLRMIQKDIKTIEEDFDKAMVRNAGCRGTVRYEDQSEPLFYQELTEDEEDVFREVLKSLGQFDGLDNFTWLDLFKKKLSYKQSENRMPYISFSKNEGLQVPKTLLGRLFTAISRKKAIEFQYKKFGCEPKKYRVYPYQLKQNNDRWFLLCTPLASKEFAFDPKFIANFALDRMDEDFKYLEDEPYIETSVDLQSRFDEIIGVTLIPQNEVEDIIFAVSPKSLPYIESKWMHISQIKLFPEYQDKYKAKYPTLSDYTFFSIECRENYELYSKFASYTDSVVLLEPEYMRKNLKDLLHKAADKYNEL